MLVCEALDEFDGCQEGGEAAITNYSSGVGDNFRSIGGEPVSRALNDRQDIVTERFTDLLEKMWLGLWFTVNPDHSDDSWLGTCCRLAWQPPCLAASRDGWDDGNQCGNGCIVFVETRGWHRALPNATRPRFKRTPRAGADWKKDAGSACQMKAGEEGCFVASKQRCARGGGLAEIGGLVRADGRNR